MVEMMSLCTKGVLLIVLHMCCSSTNNGMCVVAQVQQQLPELSNLTPLNSNAGIEGLTTTLSRRSMPIVSSGASTTNNVFTPTPPPVAINANDGAIGRRPEYNHNGPPVFPSEPKQASLPPQIASAQLEKYRNIAIGAQRFGLDLFTILSDAIAGLQDINDKSRNFMISPFSMWSLLLLLTEGANGQTLKELTDTLYITDHLELRRAYRDIVAYLKVNTTTIEVASLQAMFTDLNQPVKREFENIMERDYGAQLYPVDFSNLELYKVINDQVKNATRGLIPHSVLPQDLENARMFLMSALYFKGQWKHPFNRSFTRPEMFYDEDDNPLGMVDMMVQEASFNYAGINELEAYVLELPYGKEDRLSMLVLLPKPGVRINKVVHNLKNFGVAPIFERIAEASYGFEDEEVEVIMPKFTTNTDYSMQKILNILGIYDLFDAKYANLSNMAPNLFVSRIFHITKIIVNEEGTEAAALTGSVLDNKSTPSKFYLNHPFLYLIFEKRTNVLLFAGQVADTKFN